MEDITVSRLLYVLKLENEKYYIGSTYNLNFRYAQHCQGRGARWTKLHKPVGIVEVVVDIQMTENQLTDKYIEKYGKWNVRGGSFCQV